MAYFLFIDESGQDQRESPYEVLAGVAIEDKKLWPLILALQSAEINCFGRRYSNGESELKARKLLRRKTFNLSSRCALIPENERIALAKESLDDGASAEPRNLSALAQSKLLFVARTLEICKQFDCKIFASIIATAQRDHNKNFLRKDYSYLFERFYYYLEDQRSEHAGVVVFDELEKSKSHVLIEQLSLYFKETRTGQKRATRVIPEPLFVHSDLTTGVQLADLVSYLLSWGFRTGNLSKPPRKELEHFVHKVTGMRYKAVRNVRGHGTLDIWSIAIIDDLRTSLERI